MKTKILALLVYVDAAYLCSVLALFTWALLRDLAGRPLLIVHDLLLLKLCDLGKDFLFGSFLIGSPIQLLSFGIRRKWLEFSVTFIALAFAVIAFLTVGFSNDDLPLHLRIGEMIIVGFVLFMLIRTFRKRAPEAVILGCGKEH